MPPVGSGLRTGSMPGSRSLMERSSIHGQVGRSYLSRTLMGIGRAHITFQPVAFPASP